MLYYLLVALLEPDLVILNPVVPVSQSEFQVPTYRVS